MHPIYKRRTRRYRETNDKLSLQDALAWMDAGVDHDSDDDEARGTAHLRRMASIHERRAALADIACRDNSLASMGLDESSQHFFSQITKVNVPTAAPANIDSPSRSRSQTLSRSRSHLRVARGSFLSKSPTRIGKLAARHTGKGAGTRKIVFNVDETSRPA